MHALPAADSRPIAVPGDLGLGIVDLGLLGPSDEAAVADHLLRLDARSRRLRFGVCVNDGFLAAYARGPSARRPARPVVRLGLFLDGVLRGMAELHFDPAEAGLAEGALSLEAPFRGHGHGTRLFAALLSEAREQGVERLTLQCLRENAAMRRLVSRFHGELSFEAGEVVATLRVPSGGTARPAARPQPRMTWSGACAVHPCVPGQAAA